MQKNIFQRGFTLIELLVVIAIIGILASVVLASLNDARTRGSDAAIKSNVNNMRAQAELFYNDSRTYDDLCDIGANPASGPKGIEDSLDSTDDLNAGGAVNCHDGPNGWAVEAQLVANTNQWYCVDSTGNATTTSATSITASDLVCG